MAKIEVRSNQGGFHGSLCPHLCRPRSRAYCHGSDSSIRWRLVSGILRSCMCDALRVTEPLPDSRITRAKKLGTLETASRRTAVRRGRQSAAPLCSGSARRPRGRSEFQVAPSRTQSGFIIGTLLHRGEERRARLRSWGSGVRISRAHRSCLPLTRCLQPTLQIVAWILAEFQLHRCSRFYSDWRARNQ
jgi:hypothetical protein